MKKTEIPNWNFRFLSLIIQLHTNKFAKPQQTKIFGLHRPLLVDALKKEQLKGKPSSCSFQYDLFFSFFFFKQSFT